MPAMYRSNAARAAVRRFLRSGFTVMDLAEPIVSFDAGRPAAEVREAAERRDLVVAGVRAEGEVVGYVEILDLREGRCGDAIRFFGTDEVVFDDAPLGAVIDGLDRRGRLFVAVLGAVGGIVQRRDVDKPPGRMWLFGLVSMLEEMFTRLVETHWPKEAWARELTDARMGRARELQRERRRRGFAARLIDCLAFGDKGKLVLRVPGGLDLLGAGSMSQGREAISAIESLRNNLAHAQPIAEDNWSQIAAFARHMDGIFALADRLEAQEVELADAPGTGEE